MRRTILYLAVALMAPAAITSAADPLAEVTRSIEGALEGEQLEIANRSEGVGVSRQKIGVVSLPPLSRGTQLFVRLGKKGDFIELTIPPSAERGERILKVRLVTSWDYATVQIVFNGHPLGQPVDTYSPKVDSKLVTLGPVTVRPGQNVLRLEAVGRDPASSGYHAGIDAVLLEPRSASGDDE